MYNKDGKPDRMGMKIEDENEVNAYTQGPDILRSEVTESIGGDSPTSSIWLLTNSSLNADV